MGRGGGPTAARVGWVSCSFEQSGRFRAPHGSPPPKAWDASGLTARALLGSGLGGNKGLHSTATLGSGNNIAVYLGDTFVQRGAQTRGIVVESTPTNSASLWGSPSATPGPGSSGAAGLGGWVSPPQGLPGWGLPERGVCLQLRLLGSPGRWPSHFLTFSLWSSKEYLRSRVQCSCSFTWWSSFWNLGPRGWR